MILAFASIGASDRPRVTLLTALPLVWGEGDAADVLAGRTARSETLKAIDARFDVQAIDTLSVVTLGRNVAIIAQPRRLTPQELVTFDTWVRTGRQAMIFADPELVWPSRYAPGDSRLAPPITLLDPLFAHWGVALRNSDRRQQIIRLDGVSVALLSAGMWEAPKSCSGVGTYVLDCRIGKGRVILVGDADVLDPRLWQERDAQNPAWVTDRLLSFSNATPVGTTQTFGLIIFGVMFASVTIGILIHRYL